MRKLSTGYKINSARDDAAGLAIANKLSVQTGGLNRASQNALDGVSLIQTTDGALSGVTDMLQRMRELAVQAANGVLTPEDQAKIQSEVDQYVMEITDNANKTEFNKIKVLSGEADTVTMSRIIAGSGSADAERIVTVLAVSENMPAGQLFYTIQQPALPAEVSLDVNSLYLSDVSFAINSIPVTVSSADSMGDIRRKLLNAAELASLDILYDAGGTAFLATRAAGKDQRLVIASGSPGGPNTSASGSDAVIPPAGVYLRNPDGTLNDGFNNAKSITENGNEITIASANGQAMRLGIRVFFRLGGAGPGPGDFVYGNGTAAASPPYSDGLPVQNGALPMFAEVRGYGPLYLQVGPNYNQRLSIQIPKLTSETLGFAEYKGGRTYMLLDYKSPEGAANAIVMIDRALAEVSDVRAKLGAYQNRLEQTVSNIDTAALNMEAARSRIQDTDMAMAMTQYTQYNVKYQAGIAVLAQANQRPQQVLSLLQ